MEGHPQSRFYCGSQHAPHRLKLRRGEGQPRDGRLCAIRSNAFCAVAYELSWKKEEGSVLTAAVLMLAKLPHVNHHVFYLKQFSWNMGAERKGTRHVLQEEKAQIRLTNNKNTHLALPAAAFDNCWSSSACSQGGQLVLDACCQ